VTFTLGIFDLFTYAIPGSLQLAFFAYLAVRLEVVDSGAVSSVPGWIMAIGVAVASYLLGHVTFLASALVDKVYRRPKDGADAWRAVSVDAAEAGERRLRYVNPMLLMAGAELRDREVAAEIARLRATGLMLRSAVVPTCFAALAAFAEAVVGPWHLFAGALGLLFVICAAAFARHGQQLRFWANTKTYQIAYWLELTTVVAPAETADEVPA
jgi:hypothetical protein